MKKPFFRTITLIICLLTITAFSLYGSAEEITSIKDIKLGLITYPYRIQWMEAYDAGFTWYCEDNGISHIVQKPEELTTEAQISACRTLLLQGVSGIIVTPISDAAGNEIVRLAKEENVPVMTTNVDVDNPDVLMSVSFSSSGAASICAEHSVDYLKTKYGEAKGAILLLWYMPGNIQNRQRHDGFTNVISNYPDINVFEQLIEKGSVDQGKTGTLAAFRSKEKFDVIYAINSDSGHGAILAVKELGYGPDDIFIVQIDADSAGLEFIKEGYADLNIDQPTQFYNAIAVKYMVDYLLNGEGALPEVGLITEEKLKLTGKLHNGVNPWGNSKQWSPARVIMSKDLDPELYEHNHLCFIPHPNIVTQENCEDPTLWARLLFK
jgi:ABC-type sugar transport system substrate-binding protein